MQRVKFLIAVLFGFASDLGQFLRSAFQSRSALVAENLFLRKQLAFYREHKVGPRRMTDVARLSLVLLSRLFDWKKALVVVKPDTLIGWHRKGFKLFWRWKSRPGRPALPLKIRELIARMALENPTWGQARVAAELSLKLGIFLSPRTVRKYWPWEPSDCRRGRRISTQQWTIFVRNHANAVIASDFLVAVTARFQFLYVLIILELGSRRILHCNVTATPRQNGRHSSSGRRSRASTDIGSSFMIGTRSSPLSSTTSWRKEFS